MENNNLNSILETLATQHYLIAHNKVDSSTASGRRISFFRMNNEAELQQAIASQVDYPCLVVPHVNGTLKDDGFNIYDRLNAGFEIRTALDPDLNFDAIEQARESLRNIALAIVARIQRMCEEEGACGDIAGIELNGLRYDYTGPFNINEYGFRVSFTCEFFAFDRTLDIDSDFPNT